MLVNLLKSGSVGKMVIRNLNLHYFTLHLIQHLTSSVTVSQSVICSPVEPSTKRRLYILRMWCLKECLNPCPVRLLIQLRVLQIFPTIAKLYAGVILHSVAERDSRSTPRCEWLFWWCIMSIMTSSRISNKIIDCWPLIKTGSSCSCENSACESNLLHITLHFSQLRHSVMRPYSALVRQTGLVFSVSDVRETTQILSALLFI